MIKFVAMQHGQQRYSDGRRAAIGQLIGNELTMS